LPLPKKEVLFLLVCEINKTAGVARGTIDQILVAIWVTIRIQGSRNFCRINIFKLIAVFTDTQE